MKMIDAKELRLDNWIEYTPFTGVPEYTQINVFHLSDLTGQTDVAKPEWKTRYKTIPLTKEILEKCGFYADKSKAHIVYNDFGNIYQLNLVNGIFESSYLGTPINYLHELQNHFYSTTKKELEVNL